MEVKTSRGFAGLEMFPFLLIPVLIYNFLAFISAAPPPGSAAATLPINLRSEAFVIPMLSGSPLSLSWGDMLLLLSIVFLLIEVIKAARTSASAIVNNMLSLAVFVLCLVEFLLLPSFASSTFFLLTMIVLLDAMAGMTVTIISARRDFDVGGINAN